MNDHWLSLPTFRLLDGLEWGIWGGAARAFYLDRVPRDIDVAVNCSKGELLDRLPNCFTNRFGGLKVVNDSIPFDIWCLADTWNIKKAGLEPTFENLARVGPFNADCIVLTNMGKVDPYYLIDEGFTQCLVDKRLEITFEPNPHPQHNILRGLRLIDSLQIQAGASFVDYVKENSSNMDAEIRRYEQYMGLKVNRAILEAILHE